MAAPGPNGGPRLGLINGGLFYFGHETGEGVVMSKHHDATWLENTAIARGIFQGPFPRGTKKKDAKVRIIGEALQRQAQQQQAGLPPTNSNAPPVNQGNNPGAGLHSQLQDNGRGSVAGEADGTASSAQLREPYAATGTISERNTTNTPASDIPTRFTQPSELGSSTSPPKDNPSATEIHRRYLPSTDSVDLLSLSAGGRAPGGSVPADNKLQASKENSDGTAASGSPTNHTPPTNT